MRLGPDPKQLREYLGSLVPAAVLTWALAILTASYLGVATKVDAAFISSLVTSVLAVYGISRKEADRKETPPPVKQGRPPGKPKANPPVVSTTQTNGKP
jgi:hypothetical protein